MIGAFARRRHPGELRVWASAFALLAAVAVGIAISVRIELAIVVVAPVIAIVLSAYAAARTAFIVIVGLAVLGPPELNVAKALYFGGVVVALTAAFRHVTGRWRGLPSELVRLATLSLLAAILIGGVATYRLASGTEPAAILRDLLPYLLLAAAPIFAIDAGSQLSLARLQFLATAGLALGSIGFLASWSLRRGIVTAEEPAAIFGGFFMPVALLILAAVCMGSARRRTLPIWLLLAGLAVATVVITGTRSFVLEIPAAVIAVAIAAPTAARRVARVSFAIASTGAAATIVTVLIALNGVDIDLIVARWAILTSAIFDPSGDQSLGLRLAQTIIAQNLFLSSPVFGVSSGLGAAYSQSGATYASDTPLALLAGLGLVGLAAVVLLFAGWVGVSRPFTTPAWPRATMVGMLLAAVTFSLILPIVEDKGVGFAFILVGAPAAWSLIHRQLNAEETGPVTPAS